MSKEVFSHRPYQSFETVVDRGRKMGVPQPQRFDGLYLRNWFTANSFIIGEILQEKLSTSLNKNKLVVNGTSNLHLSKVTLEKLAGLFPESAHERSGLTLVSGKQTLWMHRDITSQNRKLTTNSDEKLSSTAVALAETSHYIMGGNRLSVIELYRLPVDEYGKKVASLIQAATFVHEFFHVIAKFKRAESILKLPEGEVIESNIFISQVFRRLIEMYPAISKYSASYRQEGEKYRNKRPKIRIRGISEEFAENGALHVLGYNLGSFVDITKNPMQDRLPLVSFFTDFLNAQVLDNASRDELAQGQIKTTHPNTLVTKYRR